MRFTIAFFLLFSSINLCGAELSYLFKRYDAMDGFPSLQAYEIKQDPKGYVWIATDRGLVKYNGYDFKVFTVNDGLSTDVVFRLHILPNGQIACYGKDRKIHAFDGNKFHLLLPAESMVDIVSTNSNLLSFKVNEKGFSFSSSDLGDNSVIHLEYKSETGVGESNSENGTHIYDNEFGLEIAYKRGDLNNYLFYNGNQIAIDKAPLSTEGFAYVARSKEIIYFSVGPVLYRFDPVNDKGAILLTRFENTILTLKADTKGNLFIGTRFDGLWRIDTNRPSHRELLLPNKSVSGILIDSNNGIWVTTLYNGIYYCNDWNDRVVILDDREEKMIKLKVINGRVYGLTSKYNLLTSNGAVLESVETEKENVINMYTNLTYDFIGRKGYGFHYDTVGEKFNKYSYAGIAYFKGDNKYYGLRKSKITEYLQTESNHYNINDFVYSMSEFGDDKLLLGCGSGVMKFSKKNALLDSINTVLYRTNNYYLANNIVNYAPSEPFFKSKVRDIKNIGDSLLLFGSAEQGLFIREVNKKDYWLRIKDGLISNSINRVYFNEGQILVITNSGISLIEKGKKIKNYTSDNGLLSNFVNDALIHNDTLWAATEGGTSIFPLEQKRASEIPIYLTEIKVNGQIIALKDEYELEHDENELDISIDGLSFEQEGNIKYKYRFFGADQQWIETENRTIRYSNLPSGEFIFEVKAENYSNHWTEPVVLFHLNKKQPFWEHALFLSAMVLLLIGIIWVVVWLVYRKRRRIEGDKIRILNLERKTLQAQMNPHFMFNSLNSLQNLIIKDKKREAQEYLGEFASLTRLALIQSTKNSIRLHEEIAILQHYIELEKIRYSDSFEYEIVIELIDQKIEISPMLIQPFVENAIIHGLSNKLHDGKLKITFKERNNKTIQCIIEDNGSGRKKHENPNKHKSLGISLVKERLDILLKEKAIHIEDLFADEQPKGTRVVLVLPFKKFKL